MDQLSQILAKQAGFEIDQGQVTLHTIACTQQVELLIQLVAGWCLEKNKRFLFAHQATQQIAKDFEWLELPQQQQRPQ
jgi:hypothetical protein